MPGVQVVLEKWLSQSIQFLCKKQQDHNNVHIILGMSYLRVKPQSIMFERQKSIDCTGVENDHYIQNCRKKYKRSKQRQNTHSMQSLEVNRCSLNLPLRTKQTQRRKLLSIPSSDSKPIFTERPEIQEETTKKSSQHRVNLFQFRNKSDRMHTIDESHLEPKQSKLGSCVRLMPGFLEDIKNQKSHRRILLSKPKDDLSNEKTTVIEKIEKKESSQSKFQSYVKNLTRAKQDTKILLLKKGKSRSTINNENIRSSIVLNADRFETIFKDRPKQIKIIPPISICPQETIEKQPSIEPLEMKKLDDLQCSSIENINQSSFISQFGKKSLRRHLQSQNQENFNICRQKETIESRKMLKMINNKKLKHVFPLDFF